LHLYDFSWSNNKHRNSWIVDTQFYIPRSEEFHDDETFNVEYFINENTTIEMLEGFFEKLWSNMGCRYYELWSEC
jgi:hypothetical protein